MDELTGRAAVITGAASGIGLALAHRAAAEGMDLVLADLDLASLDTAAAGISGVRVVTQACDVSISGQVQELADRAFAEFGSPGLVCNNAGVGGGGAMADLELADWEWVLGVNLWGVIYGIQSFLRPMMASGLPGHIVNTASIAGLLAGPGMGPYSVSKFGVVALSETLRVELEGSNVGTSVLCPAFVQTRIHEAERSRPAELAVEREVDPARAAVARDLVEKGLAPTEVADRVFAAVRSDRFWIFTHDDIMDLVQARHANLMANRPSAIDAD